MSNPIPGTGPARRRGSENLESFLSGKIVARIGLGLLLIGLVFLFRWSLIQGWIGPLARVLIGAGVSSGLLAAGFVLRSRHVAFARLLQGGGVAGLYVSAFAAHRLYELVDAGTGLIQLAVISAAAIVYSLRQDDQSLAVIGVAGGLAAPLLIGGVPAFPGDFGFVAIVVAAAAVVHFRTGWSAVYAVAAGGMTALIATRIIKVEYFDAPVEAIFDLQLGLIISIVALWLAPLARAVVHRIDTELVPQVATVTVPFLGYIGSLAIWTGDGDPAWVTNGWAAVAVGGALAILIGSVLLERRGLPQLSVMHYVPAGGLATVAAVISLDGPALMVVLAAEAVGVILAGRRAGEDWLEIAGHVLLVATGVATVGRGLEHPPAGILLLNGPALAQLAVVAAFAIVAGLYHRDGDDRLPVTIVYGGGAYLGVLVWLMVELLRVPGGDAMLTGAWGLYGLGLLVAGGAVGLAAMRTLGLASIGLALSKLLLVDLATASTGWKIVLFMGFGIGLLGIGYWLSQRNRTDGSADAHPAELPAADRRPRVPFTGA